MGEVLSIVLYGLRIITLECETTSTLGPNAVKSMDYIKKCFQQKSFKIEFSTKNSVDVYPLGGELGMNHFPICGGG